MKNFVTWIIVAVVVLVGGVMWSRSLQNNDPTVVSASGIHWHPTLSIIIDGEKQDIPSNIGLVGRHSPIHTHDDATDSREAGVVEGEHKPLHLEFGSAVREDDIILKNFFDIWGRTFNSQCIFDHCTDSGGTLTMIVNGKPNTDFENYIMKDGDRIEIVFSSSGDENDSLNTEVNDDKSES